MTEIYIVSDRQQNELAALKTLQIKHPANKALVKWIASSDLLMRFWRNDMRAIPILALASLALASVACADDENDCKRNGECLTGSGGAEGGAGPGGDGPDDALNGTSPSNVGPVGNLGARCATAARISPTPRPGRSSADTSSPT